MRKTQNNGVSFRGILFLDLHCCFSFYALRFSLYAAGVPVTMQGTSDFPLTAAQVTALWQAVRTVQHFPDDEVAVRCVAAEEIRRLGRRYLARDEVGTVLAFSYGDGTHDVPLCLAAAQREALAGGYRLSEYVVLLLVHALLHVTGMDHETARERSAMRAAEEAVLAAAGFSPGSLLAAAGSRGG